MGRIFVLARHLRFWAVSPLARHDDPLGRLKRNTITLDGFDNVIICGATLQLRQSLSDCMEDGRK